MTASTPETTIGELVRAAPVRARVFEKLGIDYCCGGRKPLREVCATRGLDPATVLALLDALDPDPGEVPVDAAAMDIDALCEHIEQSHHRYLRDELPRLDFMTRKVAAVHGADEPRLVRIREVFASFAPELLAHLEDEERTIFPRIRLLARGASFADRSVLRSALEKLEREHAEAGTALAAFRELTDDYTPPDWACNTFRALYDGLERLEHDLHQHVHKENNVLFPRAIGAD